jgi:hypothetical protein
MRAYPHVTIAAWACLGFGAALAQPTSPAPAPSTGTAFGECRAGAWSGNRNLDDRHAVGKATCLVQAKQRLGVINLAASLRAGVNDQGEARRANGALREAYAQWQSPQWTLRAGRQILAWGRADRINPTDYFSVRDHTLLVPDDDEQRLGSDALLLKHELSPNLSLTGVVARFRANNLPRGSLPINAVDAPRPSRAMTALKLEGTAAGVDGSLSWFDGHVASPVYHLQPVSPTALSFVGQHERVRALGGDVATVVGRWNWRAEAAAYRLRGTCSSCTHQRRHASRVVLGVDTDVGTSANINAQLFSVRRSGYRSPDALTGEQAIVAQGLDRLNSEFAGQETGLTLRVSDRYFNDRLKLELAALLDATNRGSLWRPRLSYSFSDSLKLMLGWDHFRGPTQSFFGSRKANRVGFAEVAFVF